jgi:2-polyprenyl-3-methyl-5-hydroxy-6-metoxy-1,4-benzoquinol methylase
VNAAVPTEETLRFLAPLLPPKARILEVGCGEGHLAAALLERGHAVTALDSSEKAVAAAKTRGVHAEQVSFPAYEGGPFDVVLFASSLHHIHPLEPALDRARDLLRPQGLLIAEEFALERADLATAAWFYGTEALLSASGVLAGKEAARVEEDPLHRWRHDHAHEPALHTGEAMVSGIRERFASVELREAPYLYRSFRAWLAEPGATERVVRTLLALEEAHLRRGLLQPVGLRIIARRS